MSQVEEAADGPASPAWKVGDQVDVLSPEGIYCPATILSIKKSKKDKVSKGGRHGLPVATCWEYGRNMLPSQIGVGSSFLISFAASLIFFISPAVIPLPPPATPRLTFLCCRSDTTFATLDGAISTTKRWRT